MASNLINCSRVIEDNGTTRIGNGTNKNLISVENLLGNELEVQETKWG